MANYKIEHEFNANVIFEATIAVGGWACLVIYGKHINGYFCCLPRENLGCEMADPDEVAYNRDKLINLGLKENVACALAQAIQQLGNEK